ncbi:MAG: TetR/AcrR family transcriptional regulator [Opitutales bacterium]
MGRPSTARSRILATACQQFTRKGAQAVGVDAICQLAGVNKGSFYHFFASKETLLLACLEQIWSELRENVLETAFAPEYPPLERIDRFFVGLAQAQAEAHGRHGLYPGCIFCTLGSELAFITEPVRASVVNLASRNIAYLRAAYAEAVEEQSELRADPDVLAERAYLVALGALLEVKLLQSLHPLERARSLLHDLHPPEKGR